MNDHRRKPYWRFDRDVMNRISNERVGRGQPEADKESPVNAFGKGDGHDEVDGREPSLGLTTDRLRHEIDLGRTADKVRHPDPAAAPLGTDDEAAGTPPSARRIQMAMANETSRVAAEPHVSRAAFRGFGAWLAVCMAASVLFVLVMLATNG